MALSTVIIPLLWYVIVVHVLVAAFFWGRFWVRREKGEPGYRYSGFMAYLALGPAIGAARELQLFRVNVGVAMTAVSALLGTLLLLVIWEGHFRR